MSKFVLTAQLQLQAPTNTAQVVSQIQRQLNGINVNVQYKQAAQAKSAVDDLTDSVESAKNSTTGLGKAFGVSVKRFTALAIATRAVSLFTNKLGGAIQESIAFERELIKISQVTGKLISDLRFLTNEITNLSTSLGVSSSELLSVSRILSQAGLDAREVTVALSALAKTDLAPTFDNMAQTAEGAVAIFNQFKQGAGALEAQLGSLNAVAGQFAVESGDLISVIRRTGGVFRQAGGDLNELVALFTSVRATTRESAESIATGLRTIFTRIQRPQTIEYLKQFGVELVDSEGKFIGLYKAVGELNKALAGLEEGDLTFIQIAEQLGGFRQIGKVLPLIKEYSVAQRALEVAQEGSNSLAEDASRAQESLAIRIIKVKEEFLALIRSVSETRTFQIMANSALSLASAFIKIAEAVKPLLPLLAAVATFRLAKGIVGFAGNAISGMQGKNQGGVIQKFATGGMVPGSGNRDTVPAMLTPGEFVIRKSSVAKIGADNLAAMNQNRYAKGGKFVPIKITGDSAANPQIGQISPTGKPGVKTTKNVRTTLGEAGIKPKKGESPNTEARLTANVKDITLGEESGPFSYDEVVKPGLQFIDEDIKQSLKSVGIKSTPQKIQNDKAAQNVVSGYAFESFAAGILGKTAEGGSADFDFINPSKSISDYTKTDPIPRLLDAKNTLQPAAAIAQKAFGYKKRNPQDISFRRMNVGGLVQKFKDGGIAQRKIGYIDYDVIANPANESVVAKGMEQTGVKGIRLYADYLTNLAARARKDSSIGKLSAIYGVAGSGKTTLARGQGTDKGKLRETERFPILTPEDIQKSTEVIVLSSSVSRKKLDEVFQPADRTYTLSSTTESDKSRVASQRASRDTTGVGLEGRKPGTTTNVESDTAVGEALLSDRLGDKSVVLGRTESGRLRRKSKDELVQIIKKKIGFTWGGFSPMTAGHESIMDAAAAAGIPAQDFIYLVGSNEGIKNSDPSSYRTAIFDQDARTLLAKAGAGSKGATILPKDSGFEVPQAFDVGTQSGRRQVVVPAKGSTVFVADKDEKSLSKYRESGYDVKNLERTGGISGTQVRDLIMSGNMGQLQQVLSPNVYELISNNIKQIRNRANVLPEIISEVKRRETTSLAEVESQIKSLGISRVDNKKIESDPEYAAQVDVLKELRKKRDKIKSFASFEPYSILAKMAAEEPEQYGLDFSIPRSSAQPMRRMSKKTQKANLGGQIQKFATGGIVPGTGNRDTVPATLQAGDFVIRKRSVESIGAGNLQQMAGYATGGNVDKSVPALLTPGEYVFPKQQAQKIGYGKLNKMNKQGKYALGGEVQKFETGGKAKDFGKIGFRSTTGGNLTATYLGNKGRSGMVSANYNNGIYTVGLSKATSGYGPMLYDVVMELATSLGSMLAPDRNQVSKDAQRVWEYYFNNRNDVTKQPLDPSLWTKNQSLIDPKLYGKKETWPPKTDPAWVLQSGYKKPQRIITDPNRAINLNDPKYADFIRQSQMSYMQPAQKKQLGGIIQKFNDGGVAEEEEFANIPIALRKKLAVGPTDDDKRMSLRNYQAQQGLVPPPRIRGQKQGQESTGKNLGMTFGLAALYGVKDSSPQDTVLPNGNIVQTQYGVLDKAVSDSYEKKMTDSIIKVGTEISNDLMKDIKSEQQAPTDINRVLKLAGFENAVGTFLETSLALTGGQYADIKTETNAPIDFPQGLGDVASKFGLPSNIPTDVTRTSGSGGKGNVKFAGQIQRFLEKQSTVQKLATGGVVPGTGNRDTVPATLQAGDFVIRKSSVNSIGAGNLQKMAGYNSGGKTSDVPALLTPGEFVFSKQQASKIGYGKLNRMNKVGKYAKGGIVGGVRRFADGGGVYSTSSNESINLDYSFLDDFEIGIEESTGAIDTLNTKLKVAAAEADATAESSSKAADSHETLADSSQRAENGIYKTFLAMGAVTATLQQFRPTIEAGSTAFETGIAASIDALQKLTIYSGYLVAAFQKLNLQLSVQNFTDLFKRIDPSGVRGSIRSGDAGFWVKTSRSVTKGTRGILRSFGVSTRAAGQLASKLGSATRFLGPFIAAMTTAYVATKLFADFIKTTMNYEMVKKDAIERGDVETARSAATGQVATESFSNMAPVAAAIGALFGPIGIAVGVAVAGLYSMVRAFGPVGATFSNLAAAQAGLVKSDRDLADATRAATVAMKNFTDGSGTAADVLQTYGTAVNTVTTTLGDVERLKGNLGTDDFSERSTGIGAWGRWLASWTGTVMTAEEYNTAQREGGQTKREADQRRDSLIREMDPAINAFISQYAAAQSTAGNLDIDNISFDDVIASASGEVREGETQSTKQILESYKALQTLGLTSEQAETAMKALEQKVKNIAKEIEKTRAYIRELNVGLKALVGSASAGSLALDNYLNRQKAGYVELDNSIRTLEASVTGAALGISQADFAGTMANVANQMSQLGASSKQIDKFVGSVSAINTAQSLSPQIAVEVQKAVTAETNKGIRGATGEGRIKESAINAVGSVLRSQNVDEASIKKITAGLNFKLENLSETQKAKLEQGDISFITDALDEMGKEILQDVLPALKEKAEAEKKLIELTRARIDAENKYMEAQKVSQDIMLEGREIEAEAGGRPLNPSDRRQTILNKANIEGRLAGLSDMRSGDANDILRRNAEINARRTQLNTQRGMAASGMSAPGMEGKSGAQLSGDLERLNKIAKDQWNVTKDLIDVKKQELEMIKAKNQLEKDSMDALISGDLEKWFDQQAAMGAQAAIATGDDRLIREYGISAVGMATQDMQRMADAGVDTLYGQKLRGPGGLIEKGYSEVAFATGLDMQSAQAAAGTTDRENQLNREIIDLSRTAPDTAMTQESFERDDVIIAGMQEVVAEHKYAAAVQMAAAKLQMAAAQSESLPKPSEDSQQAAAAAGAAGAKATYGLSEKTQNLVNSQMVLEEQKQKAIESGNKEEADALQKQIDSRQSDIEASRGIKSGQWWGNTSEAEKQRLMTDVELYKQNKRSPQPVQTQTPAPPIAVGAPMPPMMQQAQMQNTQEQTPLAQAAIMPQQPVSYGSVPQAAMNFGQTQLQSQQQNPVAQAVNPAAKIAFMAQTGRAPTVENMMGGGLSRGNTYVDPGREASTEFRRLSPEEQATRTKQVFDSAVANPHGAATATLQNNQRIAEQMGLGGFTAGMNQDPLAWMQQIPATAGSFSNVGIDPTSSGFGGGTKDAALSLFSGQLPQLEGQAMQQIPATAGSFSNAGIDPISSGFGVGAKLEGQAMQQIAQGVTMPFDNKGVTITPEFDPNQQGDSNTMSVSSLVVNAAKCYVNCASCEGSDKQGQPSQQMPQGYQLPQAPQLNQQSPVEAPNAPNSADQIYGPTGMTMAEAPMKIAEQAVKMPKGMNLSKLVQRIPASALPQAIKAARGAAPAARGLAQGARNFMSSTAQKFEAGRDMARIGVKPTKPNSLTTKIGYQYQNIGEQFKQGRQIGRANRLDPRKPFGTQNYVQKAGQVYDDAVANTRLGYQNLKAGYKGGRARGFDGRFMKGADSASFKAGQRARGVVDATKQAGSFVGRQAGNVGSFVGRQAGNVGSFVAGQARRIPGVQGVEKFATNQFKNAKAGYQNLKAGYSRYSPSTGVPQARGVDGRFMKAADSRAFQAGQKARRVTDSVVQGTQRFTGGLAARGSEFAQDFQRGRNFARMQRLEAANPAAKLKLLDNTQTLANTTDAFAPGPIEKNILNSKRATTFGEKAGKFADDALNFAGKGANVVGKGVKAVAPALKVAGKVAGKALGPLDLAIGGYTGYTQKDRYARAEYDEDGNLLSRNVNDEALEQISAPERTAYGMLTGSATTGNSVTGSLLGLQQNGNADMAISGLESVARGATTGAAIAGPVGAVVGAAVGGGAEVAKNVRQLEIDQKQKRDQMARTQAASYALGDQRRSSLDKIREDVGVGKYSDEYSTRNFDALQNESAFENLAETQSGALFDARNKAVLRRAQRVKDSGGTTADFTRGMDAEEADLYKDMSIDDIITEKQTRLAETKATRKKKRNDATYFGLSEAKNVDSERYQMGVEERANLFEKEFEARDAANEQIEREKAGMAPGEAGPLATQMPAEQKATNPSAMIEAMSLTGSTIDAGAANESEVIGPPDEGIQTKPLVQAQTQLVQQQAMQQPKTQELTGVGVGKEILGAFENTSAAQMYQDAQGGGLASDINKNAEVPKAGDSKESGDNAYFDSLITRRRHPDLGQAAPTPAGAMQSAQNLPGAATVQDRGQHYMQSLSGMPDEGSKDAALSLFSGNLPMKSPETMSDSVDQMRTTMANNKTAVASSMQDLSRSATASASVGTESQARAVQTQNNQNAVTVQDQGGAGMGLDPQTIASLTEALNKFNSELASNIETLQNTTVKIQLEKTNIIVDIRGGAFFDKMKGELKQELLKEVGNQLNKNSLDAAGKPSQSESQLGK